MTAAPTAADAPTRPVVLVVDDDPLVREILVELLEDDYEVLEAPDATAATEQLERHPVQVVVCDHDMPGTSGIEFLSLVRRTHPLVQRLLLTAHTERGMLLDAINEGGVARYLQKGDGFERVPAEVASAVRAWEKERAAHDAGRELAVLSDHVRSAPFLARRMDLATRSVGRLFVAGTVALGVVLVLGVLVLLGLYVLKSGLGIDLFSDTHLGDLIDFG